VKVGSTEGRSLAAARSREDAKRLATATEAIEEDPFVRELRQMGAEVVPSSVKPADPGPDETSKAKR
jgi:hypothetical protein